MPHYKHPHVVNGSISVGETSIPVRGGVVEIDEALGRQVGWPLASDEDIKNAASVDDADEIVPSRRKKTAAAKKSTEKKKKRRRY